MENKADAVEGEGYLSCPVCDSTVFSLRRQAGKLVIECREHKRQGWRSELPLSVEASAGDDLVLDEAELANSVELLPDQNLLEILSDVINRHLPGYTFDADKESFIVRGPHLLYFPDRSKIREVVDGSARTVVYVNQHIGRVQGGEVLGVRTDDA